MGGPDEGLKETNGACSIGPLGWGWYKNHGLAPEISTPILCDPDRALANDSYSNDPENARKYCVDYFLDAANGIMDSEPDLFTYNFPGGAGKFVFDETGKIYTFPWEDYYIQPVNDPSKNEFFKEWKVITPDGTKYYFGGVNATEKSYQNPELADADNSKNNYNTVWYLYRIESVNSTHWIELSYVKENYMIANRWPHNFNFPYTSISQAKQVLTFSKVQGVRLKKITTSSGTVIVDFIESEEPRQDLNAYGYWTDTNVEAKALYKIKIQGLSGLCREFILNTDYFESDENSAANFTSVNKTDLKRLRLNSVQEVSCNGSSTVPPYIFSYNPTKLARRFSCAKDNWGYYNGADNNTGLVPQLIIPIRTQNYIPEGPVDRSCNEDKAKAWILEKIKYPTGGEVIFDYEVNKIDQGAYSGEMRGGLRVKRITKKFLYGPDIITDYEYSNANYYGKDPHLNDFYIDDPMSNSDLRAWATLPRQGGGNSETNFDYGLEIQGTPKAPEYSTQGYHIGYQSVKEKRSDGSYTEYVYNANVIPSPSMFPGIPSQNAIGKGVLSHKYTFDINGNPKTESHYNYDWNADFKEIKAKKVAIVNIYNFPSGAACEHSSLNVAPKEYTLKTMRLRLLSQIEEADGITNTISYSYDPNNRHQNPVSTTRTNSEGKIMTSETIYPSDENSGAPSVMYDSSNPKFKNQLGLPVESKEKVNGVQVKRQTQSFAFNSSIDQIQLTSSKTYPTGNSEYLEYQYTQDERDNVINVKASNGHDISYLWGYNGLYPVAEVKNAKNTRKVVSFTTTESTADIPISVFSSASDFTFTVDYPGTVKLQLGNNASYDVDVNYSGLNSGQISLPAKSSCRANEIVFPNVSPGKYTIQLSINANGQNVALCGYLMYPKYEKNYTYEGITETYFEGFENVEYAVIEDPVKARTGNKYYSNDFVVNFTLPNNRSYVIEYWYLDTDNSWKFKRKNYTGPSQLLSEGVGLDDIRIYPSDAQMTTYTYHLSYGVTSVTDPSNKTVYYEYDDIGRLKLLRDQNKNIIKVYDYNYQKSQ
jgi:hypothetical protein